MEPTERTSTTRREVPAPPIALAPFARRGRFVRANLNCRSRTHLFVNLHDSWYRPRRQHPQIVFSGNNTHHLQRFADSLPIAARQWVALNSVWVRSIGITTSSDAGCFTATCKASRLNSHVPLTYSRTAPSESRSLCGFTDFRSCGPNEVPTAAPRRRPSATRTNSFVLRRRPARWNKLTLRRTTSRGRSEACMLYPLPDTDLRWWNTAYSLPCDKVRGTGCSSSRHWDSRNSRSS
jgi:hypothetical protein